jgi:DNA-directed RNA polymerase subunit RPC12/RpoP
MYDEDYACGTCWKTFAAGVNARDMHCNATVHRFSAFECDRCPRYFNSQAALEDHMWAKNHFTHPM